MPSEYGYEKLMRREQERESAEQIARRAAAVGLSGGISGALIGGAGSLLASASPRGILRAIGIGAGGGAALAGGANVVGSAALPQDDDDPSINTRRGGVGGAILGGLAGAGLGAVGHVPGATPSSAVGRLQKALGRTRFGPLLGAGLGALGGAGVGAFLGSDEGMQYDAIRNEALRRGVEL